MIVYPSVVDENHLFVATEVNISFEQLRETIKGYSVTLRSSDGFGLRICEALLKALGGSVFELAPKLQGSIISFSIPIGCPNEHSTRHFSICSFPSAVPQDSKVLVIDDCPSNTFTIAMMLKSVNIQCLEAHSATEGIRILQTDDSITLVLLDLDMPEVNGFECMQIIDRLSSNQELASFPPVVAHSASAFEEDKKRCLSLGFAGFLQKPVSRALLLRTVAVYTSTD